MTSGHRFIEPASSFPALVVETAGTAPASCMQSSFLNYDHVRNILSFSDNVKSARASVRRHG